MLGQDQDLPFGGTDPYQGAVGSVTQFNLWNSTLTPDNIKAIANCKFESRII